MPYVSQAPEPRDMLRERPSVGEAALWSAPGPQPCPGGPDADTSLRALPGLDTHGLPPPAGQDRPPPAQDRWFNRAVRCTRSDPSATTRSYGPHAVCSDDAIPLSTLGRAAR
ncbi:hypothetical protein GCM10010388_63850 [Streptomyces mauvecolor]